MCGRLDANENINSRINLIFVGAFHPKCILSIFFLFAETYTIKYPCFSYFAQTHELQQIQIPSIIQDL